VLRVIPSFPTVFVSKYRKEAFFAFFFAFALAGAFGGSTDRVYAAEKENADGGVIETAGEVVHSIGVGMEESIVTGPVIQGVRAIDNAISKDASEGSWWETKVKEIFIGIITLESYLVNAAAIIFALVLDSKLFLMLMNNPVFYLLWKIVRDTVNMIFIFVLLFSAFSTIFQFDRYKWNRILWTVIIMALLTNFSWPIARTIIDFFNSMLYFFVQAIFHTSGKEAASSILSGADLQAIFLPNNSNSSWTQVLLAIVVMGIFAWTLLKLALLLLIRLVTLPILTMLSPIGFAGLAAPMTHGYAKKWWDSLFKYASYGPITVFFVLAALLVLQSYSIAKL
jgi:hypothetical protein